MAIKITIFTALSSSNPNQHLILRNKQKSINVLNFQLFFFENEDALMIWQIFVMTIKLFIFQKFIKLVQKYLTVFISLFSYLYSSTVEETFGFSSLLSVLTVLPLFIAYGGQPEEFMHSLPDLLYVAFLFVLFTRCL